MILLDTHVLLWWLADMDNLSAAARARLDQHLDQTGDICVSSISAWEIAMLTQKGRLALTIDVTDWIRHAEQVPAISFVPVNNDIAMKSTLLPEPLHKDPADRLIIATARHLACPLVTADSKLLTYPHVDTVW